MGRDHAFYLYALLLGHRLWRLDPLEPGRPRSCQQWCGQKHPQITDSLRTGRPSSSKAKNKKKAQTTGDLIWSFQRIRVKIPSGRCRGKMSGIFIGTKFTNLVCSNMGELWWFILFVFGNCALTVLGWCPFGKGWWVSEKVARNNWSPVAITSHVELNHLLGGWAPRTCFSGESPW